MMDVKLKEASEQKTEQVLVDHQGGVQKSGDKSGSISAEKSTSKGGDKADGKKSSKYQSLDPRNVEASRQLALMYPQLFGVTMKPLKRGIFQDILDKHPEIFDAEVLKEILARHTRSTRYLTAVADGQERCDLDGLSVEKMAIEHIYYALHEVYRRRQTRQSRQTPQDLHASLVAQVVRLFDQSELNILEFKNHLLNKNTEQNATLDEALELIEQRSAKDSALLRAFEAEQVGSIAEFADMYGFHPQVVEQAIVRARESK